jgi:hypothetical protein
VEVASLLCDVASSITRSMVLLADRAAIVHAIHAHPGIRAKKRMSALFFLERHGQRQGSHSNGHMYLLTAIERSTRWVEAVPLRNMEASTCTDAFIANWVARFGVPATVTD